MNLQLIIKEITSSSSQALQAIKLLAQYQGDKIDKVLFSVPSSSAECTGNVSLHFSRIGKASDMLRYNAVLQRIKTTWVMTSFVILCLETSLNLS